MAIEIERKWVAAVVPADRLTGAGSSLRQGYVALDGDVAVRVRIAEKPGGATAATLTVKAGGGLARTEVEVPLSLADAEALWPHTDGWRIDKRRHRVELADGRVAEVDVYADRLDGLCTIEVEFASIDDATAFTPPAWFGKEVTGDTRWSNAALAEHGRPD